MTTQQPENKLGGLPAIDVNEYGGKKDGERQVMNRRLFMQLLVFDVARVVPVHVERAVQHVCEGALDEIEVPAPQARCFA